MRPICCKNKETRKSKSEIDELRTKESDVKISPREREREREREQNANGANNFVLKEKKSRTNRSNDFKVEANLNDFHVKNDENDFKISSAKASRNLASLFIEFWLQKKEFGCCWVVRYLFVLEFLTSWFVRPTH